VIEHDMPLVTGVSDRMIALDQGRVLVAGRPTRCSTTRRSSRPYLGDT
jgi:ABC-type branched-subunit amino acid transport system ATPase component